MIVNPRDAGFTYLAVLFAIAFMGLGLALTGEVWRTALTRDREVELLYAGNQYRRAIERYYVSGPRQFPGTLEDLLKDPRKPGTERYLRKLYFDPLTGKSEWGLVKSPQGGIMGVYSLSEDPPKKVAGFAFAPPQSGCRPSGTNRHLNSRSTPSMFCNAQWTACTLFPT